MVTKEELKKLLDRLEEKIDTEDWWYARDIAIELHEKLLSKIREVL